MKPIHTLTINNETYDLQDHRLDQGFRLIATAKVESGQQIRQIEISADGEGNPFACREFYILATLPPKTDTATGWAQLYIGHELWNGWECFLATAFSDTAVQRYRFHLRNALAGYWVTDVVKVANTSQPEYAIYNNTNLFGTLRGMQPADKIEKLYFYTKGTFPAGTVLEVYGK